jgi:hypothetical protein
MRLHLSNSPVEGNGPVSIFRNLALASRLLHDGTLIGKGKRPRDRAVPTGQIPPPEPEVPKVAGSAAPAIRSEYMAAIGRKGGQLGGKRHLKTKEPTERSKDRR